MANLSKQRLADRNAPVVPDLVTELFQRRDERLRFGHVRREGRQQFDRPLDMVQFRFVHHDGLTFRVEVHARHLVVPFKILGLLWPPALRCRPIRSDGRLQIIPVGLPVL